MTGWKPSRAESPSRRRCAARTSGQVASSTRRPRARTSARRRSDAPCAVIITRRVSTSADLAAEPDRRVARRSLEHGLVVHQFAQDRQRLACAGLGQRRARWRRGRRNTCPDGRSDHSHSIDLASRSRGSGRRSCGTALAYGQSRICRPCGSRDIAMAFFPSALLRLVVCSDDLLEQGDVVGEGLAAGGGQRQRWSAAGCSGRSWPPRRSPPPAGCGCAWSDCRRSSRASSRSSVNDSSGEAASMDMMPSRPFSWITRSSCRNGSGFTRVSLAVR